jgi:hypothetical protein
LGRKESGFAPDPACGDALGRAGRIHRVSGEDWIRQAGQRACVEQRIEELKSDLAADDFCLREFFATEAAFLSILMLFNPSTDGENSSAPVG